MNYKKLSNLQYDICIYFFLFLITFTVYWQVRDHEFINFDDTHYVTENIHVRSGFTKKNLISAFHFSQKGDLTYYHPITWISHTLDCHFFGLSPGAHHLINLLFHLMNTTLLFFVFKLMTGQRWQSAFVAALFALHPFNVDTVAWISERKNLLSTFFWLLTLLAYTFYVKKKSMYRYAIVFTSMLLGLLAKPILVTIPCVLLLMDLWPLGRIRLQKSGSLIRSNYHLLIEKIPFFLLSALWVQISTISNQRIGALISTETSPMNLRIANALISYVKYLGKMIWPFDLAIFYPYPSKMFPIWQTAGAAIFLISISFLIFRKWKSLPWLTVGWLWYFGTLFPTIGIIQNGLWPAIADRWAYVPLIGIFIIIAWGIPELLSQWKYKKIGLVIFVLILLTAFAINTFNQIGYWKNSKRLFQHNLDLTKNNSIAHNNLGVALFEEGNVDEAFKHFSNALKINPYFAGAHGNIANAYSEMENPQKAINHYLKALNLKPHLEKVHYNLGVILAKLKKFEEATMHFKKELEKNPYNKEAHNNLGNALSKSGKTKEAIKQYLILLRIDKTNAKAHNNLGIALEKQGENDKAIKHYEKAIQILPDYTDAYTNLGSIFIKKGNPGIGINYIQKALQIDPNNAEAHYNIGVVFEKQDRLDEAIKHFSDAIQKKPDYAEAHNNLGAALIRLNKIKKAEFHFEKALEIRPDYFDAKTNLINITGFYNKFNMALEEIKKKIDCSPKNPTLYYQLGNLYRNIDEKEKALNQYQKALTIQPDFIPALYNAAIIYASQKDYDESISLFKKIIELKPEKNTFYYNIACLYAKQNKAMDAINWLKKAVNRGYDNWEQIKNDKDLENIRMKAGYKKLISKKKTRG